MSEAGIGMGSASERVGGPQDFAWTKAHFSDARVLPSYGMKEKEDGSYKYYANSVTPTDKDGNKEYFMITPLINDTGNVYGIDTKEVTQATAKDIKAHYDSEEPD